MLRFSKMNGAGNDFVLIDSRLGDLRLASDQIAKICDRHRGVGADGVQEGGLPGRDPERSELALEMPVQLEQHRPQLVCQLDRIGNR